MPKIQSVYFGVSPASFDVGVQPSCAVNTANVFLEVHKGKIQDKIYYRLGTVRGVVIDLFDNKPDPIADGGHPSVALTGGNVAIILNDRNSNLYYSVHTVSANRRTLDEKTAPAKFGDQDGNSSNPSVAVNVHGDVVEVHQSGGDVYWRLGKLSGNTLTWQAASHRLVQNGENASVSMNDAGRVVAVYQDGTNLFCLTGTFVGPDPSATTPRLASISWSDPDPNTGRQKYDSGRLPSVVVTNLNWVYEVHQGIDDTVALAKVYQRVGKLGDDNDVDWKTWLGGSNASYNYDSGKMPQVATNNIVAIQVHKTEADTDQLFTSASLIFDRGNWMGDHLRALRDKKLTDIVIPGSHDAGQYTDAAVLTRTQTLSIGGQLAYGVRYFDLRTVKSGGKIRIHHDFDSIVSLKDALGDVRNFMEDHNELVILKFSHYGTEASKFNQDDFDEMIDLIRNREEGIFRWLLTATEEKRLAETPLRRFINDTIGTVLVVADVATDPETNDLTTITLPYDYLAHTPNPRGIHRYRDWYAADPQNGELTVFDIYGDTPDFDKMVDGTGNDPHPDTSTERDGTTILKQGQYPKFAFFDGTCRELLPDSTGRLTDAQRSVDCDLFLLSWTLTPLTGVLDVSRKANRQLVDEIAKRGAVNGKGKRINVIFTDVVQDSRSVDVAYVLNGFR